MAAMLVTRSLAMWIELAAFADVGDVITMDQALTARLFPIF